MIDAGRDKVIFLRIDVDTVAGIEKGVPLLLDILKRYDAHATFFVPMGPDNLVWGALARLGKKDFVSQSVQMNPLKVYGLAYLIKGLLKCNGYVGKTHSRQLREIKACGHEIALHGWDHAWWSNNVMTCPRWQIEKQLKRAMDVYGQLLHERPQGFAAPAWRLSRASLETLDQCGFTYISETQGTRPSYVHAQGYVSRTLNMPLTMPTIFELYYAAGYCENRAVDMACSYVRQGGFNLFGLHAEYEILHKRAILEKIMQRFRDDGYQLVPVQDYFQCAHSDHYAVHNVEYAVRRGSVGATAVQAAHPMSV